MNKDISTLLQEIKAKTAWSDSRIASEIESSQPTVNRILNGQTECQGSTWRAIDALYMRVFHSAKPKSKHRRSTDIKPQA